MSLASTKASASQQFFGRKGLLSRWHPEFEFRPGQLAVAEAVETALATRRHLIVEAGTGTGKTLAYLIPALYAGKRVIISTGTKNLQEQLFFKDVPFLASHMETPLRVCYMKGRGNYLCRQKLYDAEREPLLDGLEELSDFRIIRDWEASTETGDRAEISGLPENSTAWAKLDARRDRCIGQKCQQFDRCFITQMHMRAMESDVVIVNHHLFFADLALKEEPAMTTILPEYGAVIFDEAHELEDIAGQYFGIILSNLQVQEITRDILATSARKGAAEPALSHALLALEERSARFFELFPQTEGRAAFRNHVAFFERHGTEYADLQIALDVVRGQLQMLQEDLEDLIPLVRRTREFGERLRAWVEQPGPEYVYWVERRGRGIFLQATPIDVSSVLEERLFAAVETVVLASATLAVGGSFEYVQTRVGAKYARTLAVPGEFHYETQTLLYIPQTMPDPRTPAFTAAAANEIVRLLNASRGRAFVLFTSYQQMRQVYDRVSLSVPWPVLLQGTGPRNALLNEFRATPNCVLFATASFWQGVDVPGEQLSLVVIDKIPFAVPSDPVVAARCDAIRAAGGDAFYEYQVPQAALALKQGFGRLVRSRTDRGVLSLLDTRILRQRYGQRFFDSLPAYPLTSDFRDVEQFFNV